MLDQRPVGQPHERGSLTKPGLQRRVARELGEVMLLSADGHPEADARWIPQRPQQRDLVVAQENRGVGAVAGISERADAEHPVVDEVADEHCVPLIGWIEAQRLEKALEIAVDVADDQDRQAFRSQSSPRPLTRRTALVWEPIVCSSLRIERQTQLGPKTASASCRANGRALVRARLRPAAPLKTQNESQHSVARARRTCALRSHQPGPRSEVTSASTTSTTRPPTT